VIVTSARWIRRRPRTLRFGRWQVVSELDDDMRKALKNYHEETGHAPAVGDGRVARWDPPIKKGEGKRKFGLFPAIEEAA
jgi:hypothetical protein